MAIADRTTLPAAAPSATQSAEGVTNLLGGICIHGCNVADIAGLFELCSNGIYKEAAALNELFRAIPVEHTQALTHHIGFLASMLRRMGEEIEEEANKARDVVLTMAQGGAQ
jgi:hypothetical protein